MWHLFKSARNFLPYSTERNVREISLYYIFYYNLQCFKEEIFILFPLRFLADCLCNAKKSIQRCAVQKWREKWRCRPFQFRIHLTLYFIDWNFFFPVHAGGSQDFLICTTFAQTSSGRVFYERTRSFSLSSQNFARLSICSTRYSVRS